MKIQLCKASLMLIAMQLLTVPVVFDIISLTMRGVFKVVLILLMGVQLQA